MLQGFEHDSETVERCPAQTAHSHDSACAHLITTPEALASHAQEWQELWHRDVRATPFQSLEWLLPWWKHLGTGELFCITVRDNNRLIGVLPTYVHYRRTTHQRQLLFLGTGASDYLDAIILPGREQHVVKAMWDCLAVNRSCWDVAYLLQLRSDSPLLHLREVAGGALGFSLEHESEPCYFLQSGSSSSKPNLRHNLRRYRRRAAKLGSLGLQIADQLTALSQFDTLVRFHSRRWRARGEDGVLADERVQNVHRECIPLLQQSGLLRLSSLVLNDTPIAVMYAFADPPTRRHPRIYCYLSGFDLVWQALSPGTLLLRFLLDKAVEEQVAGLDLLRGQERYKHFWGAKMIPTRTLELRP